MNKYLVRILCVGIVALFSVSFAHAQKMKYKHHFDFRKFNLGFMMGMNYNTYKVKQQVNVVEDEILLKYIEPDFKPGLNLGMITNLNLHNNFNLRFIPAVSLEQRDFKFHFAGANSDSIVNRKIEAAYLNLPILLQIRSNYYKRVRLYTLIGGELSWNFNSNKKAQNDYNLLKIEPNDFSLVIGTGLNIYGERIKLSPEIVYSIGMTDIFVPEYTTHANAISSLLRQVITVNVNFE